MKYKIALFEIKKPKAIKRWGNLLMGKFNKQAKKTLKEEGLFIETVYICEIGTKHYGIGFLYAHRDIRKSKNNELNKRHIQIMTKCTGKRIPTKEIYFLQNK